MKFSVIHPYFENVATLPKHVEEWAKLSSADVEVIIVDDHSANDKKPDTALLSKLDLHVRVYRVRSDILWNVTGARNLGAHMAKNPQLIMADFDFVVNPVLMSKLQSLDYSDRKNVYWPMTRKPDTNKTQNRFSSPHCNSFVINKDTFWEMGGYDEDFAGGWGYEDSHFHDTLGPRHGIKNVTLGTDGYLIWLDRAADHPGTIAVGRLNHDRNELLNIYKRKHPEDYRSKYIFRFKHELVYEHLPKS